MSKITAIYISLCSQLVDRQLVYLTVNTRRFGLCYLCFRPPLKLKWRIQIRRSRRQQFRMLCYDVRNDVAWRHSESHHSITSSNFLWKNLIVVLLRKEMAMLSIIIHASKLLCDVSAGQRIKATVPGTEAQFHCLLAREQQWQSQESFQTQHHPRTSYSGRCLLDGWCPNPRPSVHVRCCLFMRATYSVMQYVTWCCVCNVL